jgi:Nucleotidyltransferase domain
LEALKTILYFSIFRYPLTLNEIYSYSNYHDSHEIEKELLHLIDQKILTKIDGFYVYGSDFDSVIKRLRGNMNAKKITPKAHQQALFISKFPFVESVGISGSLSKGYYDNESDIDFFVITKHNKLWICRTLLMLYKKIFLFNSRKFFCVNYFISDQQLEIEEKNRFTATELKTLIPLQGKQVFEKFYSKNKWITDFFSKFETNIDTVPEIKKTIVTKTIEFVFNNGFGNSIDFLLKSITLKKWRTKFDFLSEDDFNVALKSTKNISKHHPSNFQKKVISSLNDKLEEVYKNYNINIVKEYV